MDINDIKNQELRISEMLEAAKTSPEKMQEFELKSLDVLKIEIDLILLKSVQNLYYILKSHPIVSKIFMATGEIVNPQNLYDYRHNLVVIKDACKKLNGLFDKFSGLIDALTEFVQYAVQLSEQGEKKKGKMYLKNVSQGLLNMSSVLRLATKQVALLDSDETYINLFEETQVFFDSSTSVIKDFYEEYKNSERQKKEHEDASSKIIDESKIVKFVPNQKELERITAIKRANDLYARFQEDFMRDLVKEVSMMNRDLYDALIDKVEKFLIRFPMPLSNDVSIGMANEAYSQISKFIEAVYDISRNTYTPIVFSK